MLCVPVSPIGDVDVASIELEGVVMNASFVQ